MHTLLRERVAGGLLILACTWPHAGLGQAPSPASSPAAAPATAPAAARPAARLPVRRVVLYKSGIGYFEHVGRVLGDQTLSIDLTSGQLDDVLKSLTTIDLGGGRISGITYNTEAPLAQRLGTLRLSLGESATRATLLTALRGARVEAGLAGAMVSGRVLSVETRQRASADGTSTLEARDELVLVSDSGDVRTIELRPGVAVRMIDADLRQQVGQYLDLMSSTRAQDLRRMAIATSGSGARDVFVSYVSAVPVWKTTYRLVVPTQAERKPLLQGWAIVDNTLGEDWRDVELSLVAGAPQSFIQRISQPYYVDRPVVDLPQRVSLSPQTHDATLAFGGSGLTGRVSDATGGALPGATVRALDGGRVVAQTSTTGDGSYQLAGVPPGRYQLVASLEGFNSESREIVVGAGANASQAFTLAVGMVSESVNVEASKRAAAPTFRSRGNAGRGSGGALGGVVGGLPASPPPPAPMSLDAITRAVESSAQGSDLGDLFEYKLKQPVTIARNQSALVPIVQADVSLEKVSLWSQASGRARPLRAVWLTNSTGLTLDGGSVTLIEGDAFAGEGLIEPLKPGERRLLSYAADLAVLVTLARDSSPQRVTRMRIARGVVTEHREDRARATYTVRNEDAAARDVVIEHPVNRGWTLGPGVKPVESSPTVHRFRVAVAPRATATLVVDESRPVETRYQVSSLSSEQVALLVKGPRADPAIEARLAAILAKRDAMAALQQEIAAKEEELERISDGQERVRENMKALKGSDAERTLVERYTKQLTAEEDRIDTLKREGAALAAKLAVSRTELDALIEALSVDVTVPGS
jgi:hypothetical protein